MRLGFGLISPGQGGFAQRLKKSQRHPNVRMHIRAAGLKQKHAGRRIIAQSRGDSTASCAGPHHYIVKFAQRFANLVFCRAALYLNAR
jgi:hypothetical protein